MFNPFDFVKFVKVTENLKKLIENSKREQPDTDIFKAFLQGFKGETPEIFRGEDLRLDLAIEFDDAILGCKKEIRIPRLEITDEGEFEQIVKSVTVNIPAGVSYGTKLRVKEQGDVSRQGGERGDLYVFLLVPMQDKERKRNGINIESEIKITKAQAIAGCTIVVKTSTGTKTISVPPGTKDGNSLVLKGYGVCQLGGLGKNGNHIIKFVYE